MSTYNLTDQTISSSFDTLLQIDSGSALRDGTGSIVDNIIVTSSYSLTASYAENAGGGDISALNAFTQSQEELNTTFATTGSNNFIGNQDITGSVVINQLSGSGTPALKLQNPYFNDGNIQLTFFQGDAFSQAEVAFVAANSTFQSTGDMNFSTKLTGGSNSLTFDSNTIIITGSNATFGADTTFNGNNTFNGNQTINGELNVNDNPFTITSGSNSVEFNAIFPDNQAGVKFNAPNSKFNATGNLNIQVNQVTAFDAGTRVDFNTPLLQVNGAATINDDLKLDIGASGNAAVILNPDFFSTFYGSSLIWQPNSFGGRSNLFIGEKTQSWIQVNAFSGSYDEVLNIKVKESGVTFGDWVLPSYTETSWLEIPQQGTPAFQRGLDITGSVGISGNTTQQGFVTQNFTAPATDVENAFMNVSGAVVQGRNYNRTFFGMADYPGFGKQFEDYFAIEYYDGFGYNFGSEFAINGSGITIQTAPSGSGLAGRASITTVDNYDGTADININARNGKINIVSALSLNAQDPLPSGAVGDLAVSGSALYFYDGVWKQVSLV